MRARHRWATIAVALLGYACHRQEARLAAPGPLKWANANEQEWLVGTVVQSLLDLTSFAGHGRRSARMLSIRGSKAGGEGPALSVSIGTGARAITETLQIRDSVWSPTTYLALAQRLVETEEVSFDARAPRVEDQRPLEALTNLRAAEIEKQNAIISKALSVRPARPDLHEAAALILAAFALRESAGAFSDPRVALCRMAAHLALARALRPEHGIGKLGQYAEIALLALAKRQVEAYDKLATLSPASPAERAWEHALRMRVAGDWRGLSAPATATLLERLAYFRALHEASLTERYEVFLDRAAPDDIPDWGRATLQSWRTSINVEDCGRFTEQAVQLELRESTQVGLIPPFVGGALVERLNEEPWRSPVAEATQEIRVVDPGLWAAFEQRHLLAQAMAVYHCYDGMWGLYDESLEVRKAAEAQVGRLRLYPILAKRCSFEDRPDKDVSREQAEYRKAMLGAVQLCRTRPELVTAANWECLSEKPPFDKLYPGVPAQSAWFTPAVPAGTAFDWENRLFREPGADPKAMPEYEARARIAPYDVPLTWNFLQTKYGPQPPFEALRAAWGTCVDFDAVCMNQLAQSAKSVPVEYVRLARRLCDFSPDSCFALGDYLMVHGREAEAADVFRKWAKESRDRVTVSNHLDWLVRYDFEHGRRDEALALAHMAADTGSGRGLDTLARLLELDGDLRGAEAYFKQIAERYGDTDELTAFCYRRVQAGDASRAADLNAALKKLFPSGIERKWDKAAPADGIRVTGTDDVLESAGLLEDDIIIAVNGIRVHNGRQYSIVVDFDTRPGMTVTAWRAHKTFEANIIEKHFIRTWLETYTR